MAKSKEQKRAEALARLDKRIDEREAMGQKATIAQQLERISLTGNKHPLTNIEQLFGPGDPVTGIIYADPLPRDFQPTPELDRIVELLKGSTKRFVEVQVSLETPEGYKYATYEGGGTYLNQWVSRHTPYVLYHGKHLYGTSIVVVFSHPDDIPHYDEEDNLISGVPQEKMYERRHF